MLGLSIAGLAFWSELVVDFVMALSLGIVFQYFTIAPMRGLGLRDGFVAALKADTLSLIAFEVGLVGWMIFVQIVAFPEPLVPTDPIFWFMMQIGMAIGFVTAYPVSWWLVSAGLKERMDPPGESPQPATRPVRRLGVRHVDYQFWGHRLRAGVHQIGSTPVSGWSLPARADSSNSPGGCEVPSAPRTRRVCATPIWMEALTTPMPLK